MLTVTPSAAEHLAAILKRQPLPPEAVLRFVTDEDGVGLEPSEVQASDATFDHAGRTVLAIDEQIAELLDTHTLDMIDGELSLVAADSAPDDDDDDN